MSTTEPVTNDTSMLQASSEETTLIEKKVLDDRPVVFFDGVCGFCNSSINFLLKRDRHQKLLFSPLQGETAKERLPEEMTRDLNTMVVQVDGKNHLRSSATVRALWAIGGFWSFVGTLLWLIPKPIRNFGYRIIAKYRYRIFGKRETCRVPTAEERARFLD